MFQPTASGVMAAVDTFTLRLNNGLTGEQGPDTDPHTFADRIRRTSEPVPLDSGTEGLEFETPHNPVDDHGG